MCSCRVQEGGAAELVKKQQRSISYVWKSRPSFLTPSQLLLVCLRAEEFLDILLFSLHCSWRPQHFQALGKQEPYSLCSEAALRTGRLNGAYVQLSHFSTAQHLQHARMPTTRVSSWVLLCCECLLLLSALCTQLFHSISTAQEINCCRKQKGRLQQPGDAGTCPQIAIARALKNHCFSRYHALHT